MTLLVNFGGGLLIALIIWWFWGSVPRARQLTGPASVDITVADGVYTPARIGAAAGQPITLRFIRKDPSPCAEKVLLEALGVYADLPLGKPRDITLTLEHPGEYEFTCQMGMYRGKIVVR